MFDHIFENRDKKVSNVIKLSDYLGRSLRENIEVFSIDDSENKVTFITESGRVIAGNYDFEEGISLKNIQVESADLFENGDKFNDYVNYKISNFIQNIYEEDFVEADHSFGKVLQLWESRVKFSSVKNKLYEKSQKFNGTNRIIESEEFQKLVEISPQLIQFLGENKNLINIPEINNMIRLSSTVANAFNLPHIDYDDINESSYTIPENINHSIYDMICKQELIRKELVESKNNFDLVWLNNDKISNLASLINEQDDEVVIRALIEAVCDIPYLALATKSQITQTLINNLELNESVRISQKDIKSFSSAIFEYKKPIKKLFLSMLNEKYGISVQNLKDIPTFKSLLNTQVLIFEAISKLTPKGSLLKEALSKTSQMLKGKNGVESIDINNYLELLFGKAGYTEPLFDKPIVETASLKETFSEIDSIDELVGLVMDKTQTNKPEPKEILVDLEETPDEKVEEEEEEEEKEDKKKKEDVPKEKEEEPEEEEEEPEEEEEELEEVAELPSSDEIMNSFKSFEDILHSIDFEELEEDETEEEEEEGEEKEEEVDDEEEGEE